MVFDRVREVLRKYKKMPLADMMNLALNETLSRTVMTSTTMLIALVGDLFLRRRRGRRASSFAMIFGVAVGTYSSIYVASAVVLYFGVKSRLGSKEGDGGRDEAPRRGLRPGEDHRGRLRGPRCRSTATRGRVPGGGTVHHGPLALVPAGVVAWDGLPNFAPLVERAAEFDVLLVGTGAAMGLPRGFAAARAALKAAGAGGE